MIIKMISQAMVDPVNIVWQLCTMGFVFATDLSWTGLFAAIASSAGFAVSMYIQWEKLRKAQSERREQESKERMQIETEKKNRKMGCQRPVDLSTLNGRARVEGGRWKVLLAYS